MANTRQPELSSVFDDMLAKSKEQFDGLYRSGQSSGVKSAAISGHAKTPPAARSDSQSPAIRLLNERFGIGWRYEIAEQQRAGDEAIVLCKLILNANGAVRTQFGRAKIADAPLAGASGAVQFKLGAGAGAQDEADAFRRATEAALMNCVDLV